jgi:biopolymer transport protein ExbD
MVSLEQLAEFLDTRQETDAVTLECDRASDLGRVVTVWDLCERHGVKTVSLSTRVPGSD